MVFLVPFWWYTRLTSCFNDEDLQVGLEKPTSHTDMCLLVRTKEMHRIQRIEKIYIQESHQSTAHFTLSEFSVCVSTHLPVIELDKKDAEGNIKLSGDMR